MTAEKAFQIYFAVRLYFKTGYDIFKHGTNFKGKNELVDRNDFNLIIPLMKKVSNEKSLIELCISNHLYGNPDFLYEPEYAIENYMHWIKVKESLDFTLERDLDYVTMHLLMKKRSLDDYLGNGVLNDLLSRKVEYESIILLNHRYECIDKISGFDASKYKDRMIKANKFVNKGTLGKRHNRHIDNFLRM